MQRLYFCVRTDLSPGRRAAQLIHAMDGFAALHGPHMGTVVVYQVPDEIALLQALPQTGRRYIWTEPDLDNEATAWACDAGRLNLPLLN